MSQRLELSIEGHGKDGQVLVVDGWPNFKTVDMPRFCISRYPVRDEHISEAQPYSVYKDLRENDYKPGMLEGIGLLLIILWLLVLTVRVAALGRRWRR